MIGWVLDLVLCVMAKAIFICVHHSCFEINTFGFGILPLVTLNDEVVSMSTLIKKGIFELLLKK